MRRINVFFSYVFLCSQIYENAIDASDAVVGDDRESLLMTTVSHPCRGVSDEIGNYEISRSQECVTKEESDANGNLMGGLRGSYESTAVVSLQHDLMNTSII